jgi:hypothetical protein
MRGRSGWRPSLRLRNRGPEQAPASEAPAIRPWWPPGLGNQPEQGERAAPWPWSACSPNRGRSRPVTLWPARLPLPKERNGHQLTYRPPSASPAGAEPTTSGSSRPPQASGSTPARGKQARHVGDPACGCSQLDAERIEEEVWQRISKLLKNPDALMELAQEWADVTLGAISGQADRIEELDSRSSTRRSRSRRRRSPR